MQRSVGFADQLNAIRGGKPIGNVNIVQMRPEEQAALVEFGIRTYGHHPDHAAQSDRFFSEMRSWISNVVGSRQDSSVFMDTTTLCTAARLLSGDSSVLCPETLFDLSCFVDAVVLHDFVFHLENDDVDSLAFNEALDNEPIFIALPVHSLIAHEERGRRSGVGEVLRTMWLDVQDQIQDLCTYRERPMYAEELQGIAEAWERLLGRRLSLEELFRPDEHTRWPSDGPALLHSLVEATTLVSQDLVFQHRDEIGEGLISRFVSECNHRSFFNAQVSHCLQLPYLPGLARLPFRRHWLRRDKAVRDHFRLGRIIDGEFGSKVSASFGELAPRMVRLPFFLTWVLSRISRVSEFYQALMELRRKTAGVRRLRAELESALSRGDTESALEVQRAIEQGVEGLSKDLPVQPIAAGFLAIVSGVAGTTPLTALASIVALTTLARLSKDDVEKLRRRVMRPQLWRLSRIAEGARQCSDALPKIQELWELDDAQRSRFAERLASITRLRLA